jgi:hypothetical protein
MVKSTNNKTLLKYIYETIAVHEPHYLTEKEI